VIDIPFRHLLLLTTLALIGISGVELRAQRVDSGVSYHFKPGEEIRYRIVAVDSIIIYDRVWKSLSRRRAEIVRYRCDSILPNGNLAMTVEWTDYGATEHLDTMPEVTRITHPWIGHPRTFVMSPTGRRLDLVRYDRMQGAAPGGPFEPLAMPWFGDSTVARGNDVFTNKQWLFDNVFPPVAWDGTSFREIRPEIDTLGGPVIPVELTETATVTYRPAGRSDSALTQSRINGGGIYLFSRLLGYPIGGHYDLIADIAMQNAEGETVEGRHLMSTIFELYTEQIRTDNESPREPTLPTDSATPPAPPRR